MFSRLQCYLQELKEAMLDEKLRTLRPCVDWRRQDAETAIADQTRVDDDLEDKNNVQTDVVRRGQNGEQMNQ